jgi:tripartite-type tricarboxylate transporter receptor subunit TctC
MRSVLKLLLAATCLVLGFGPMPGHAGQYPERVIKIVVPFPAGGPTDVVARMIAQSMSARLGQTVLVENLVGAVGRLGTKAVARASPDGYTLLLGGTNVNAIMGAVYRDLGFDPIASFAPVAAICVDSMALAVSPRVPAESFAQFVQYAKANPGKLTYGAPPGIYPHFASEFFKVKTGTDILFVPYKGAAPAITDLLGGHIDMVLNARSVLLVHFKSGKLRPLAVTGKVRWPELPDTPTMQELGVAGFPTEVWFGLLAPAGTSPAIVGALNAAVNDGLRSAEVRTGLAELGLEAKVGAAEDFAAALAEQAHDWKTVIEATGVKVE